MELVPSWLLPLIFYTIMLWFYRMTEGKTVMGKPRQNGDEAWRATNGRTLRRIIIIVTVVYTALLLLQYRPSL
ncbi:hypothetical protein [Hymenobacter cellulosilyticus]|uniref:Uncharacterized protein n=1 Tax=Hymenobacter cellulosilyticus TaxID=2932248 RepID=A0A8T9QEQ2_9BACT|nr:hypothetical protein [Hymenobacter cellulosilyticus]UOQ73313.1 hypothetical protein MUN79_04940 [Hymenobacter cellulosilyticus]